MPDPWEDRYSPELRHILADLAPRLAPGGGDPPPLRPDPGEAREAWARRVARARARADASALQSGRLFDAEMGRVLGPDPMGLEDAPVEWAWQDVPVQGDVIQMRLYRPAARSRPDAAGAGVGTPPATALTDSAAPDAPPLLPAVLVVHGGGYWMGGGAAGFELNDALCRKLAGGVGALVADIDHRLAPEHPFPAPADDVFSAFRWIVGHAADLGVDPRRIAVMGMSSGANLAAAAAQRSLDDGPIPVRAEVLQCPSLDLTTGSSRFGPEATEADITGARAMVAAYAGEADPADPALSPGLRPDLSGVPETLLIGAEFDLLLGDARAYARRLEEAGVPVTLRVLPMTHVLADPVDFRAMHDGTVAWLRKVLA